MTTVETARGPVSTDALGFGHSGDTADLEYLEALLARGSYLGMDRFGLYGILSKKERVETIATLCNRGYADRMVLSQDASCGNDWFPPGTLRRQEDRHFCHISRDVLPLLQAAGVSDADIATMLVDNPCRIFEQSAKY